MGSEDDFQPYLEELAYCASKAGIINFAEEFSKAYGPDSVLVNSVSPAFIATPMTDKMEKRAEELGVTVDEALAILCRKFLAFDLFQAPRGPR